MLKIVNLIKAMDSGFRQNDASEKTFGNWYTWHLALTSIIYINHYLNEGYSYAFFQSIFSQRFVGFSESAEKMVAGTDHYHFDAAGGIDSIYGKFGFSAVHLCDFLVGKSASLQVESRKKCSSIQVKNAV